MWAQRLTADPIIHIQFSSVQLSHDRPNNVCLSHFLMNDYMDLHCYLLTLTVVGAKSSSIAS